ncbi:hypothetical protein BASA81_017969 [Batrachochytrium salamandrivorans]|nr:hypothetical protein BASA81_017969 [Batrachochytrium salamandrivorans]
MHAKAQHRVGINAHVFYTIPEVSPRSERTPPVLDSRPTWRRFCAKTNWDWRAEYRWDTSNPSLPMHAETQHRVEIYVHVFYTVPEVLPRLVHD